jgi:hypothetical protein
VITSKMTDLATGAEKWRCEATRRGPFIFERHSHPCACSYCEKANAVPFFGLWLPACKAWNSWRVLWLRGRKWNYYARWTAFWKKRPPA